MPDSRTLVVNTGSSSLKLGIYRNTRNTDADPELVLDALADDVGTPEGKLELRDESGKTIRSGALKQGNHQDALREALQWFREIAPIEPSAIGHRVVHGGPRLVTHQLITSQVLDDLRQCVDFAPLHIPLALSLIEEAERSFPQTPQFACFDTAFHRTLPEAASRFALPDELFDAGIRRYGFHGLSYESVVHRLGRTLPSRVVMAHLGSGASLAAVKDGCSVDTSMGLTPTGGIPMATRTGDLDPGVLLYLMRSQKLTADDLQNLLNRDSGLKAISGGKADMRELEAAAKNGDKSAALAIQIFCMAIAKTIAAYAAVLGGLELLIFAGGIGEHSVRVRHDVCSALGFMGVALDEEQNQSHAETISTSDSKVQVRVVASEEDLQIARHCQALMQPAA